MSDRASAESFLRELVSLPTAPFHEERVAARIVRYAESGGLRWRMDRHGNLRVWPRRAARGTPVFFLAHMDHPGFAVRAVRGRTAVLEILGGAPPVRREARLLLFGAGCGAWEATATGPERRAGRDRRVRVRLPAGGGPEAAPEFGMWDLPPFRRDGTRIHARGLDDVAGCAAILAAIDRLSRGARPPAVAAIFTRAEEVGFVGASAMALTGSGADAIPRQAVVISVETSRWRPGAEMGKGPVVRLGDRAGLFDPEATSSLLRVAAGRAPCVGGIRHQKCLLDGGACEATALRVLGYRTTGLACPLGNYHNHAWDRRGGGAGPGVAPEFIDLRDWLGLVDLIAAAARGLPAAMAAQRGQRRRVLGHYRRYRSRL
jgi:putative aminopeptidase FrvX